MSIGMCAGSEWVKQDLDIALFCMEDIWLKLQYQIKWNNNNTAPFVLAPPCRHSKKRHPEFRFRFSYAWISLHFTNSLRQFRDPNAYALFHPSVKVSLFLSWHTTQCQVAFVAHFNSIIKDILFSFFLFFFTPWQETIPSSSSINIFLWEDPG